MACRDSFVGGTGSHMINIFLADDHAIVRRGLKQIISETHDMRVAAEAERGDDLLSKVFQKHFDLVLMDLSTSGTGGLEILRQLKKIRPRLPVLMLSIYPEEQYVVRALKAGASGYLTKESGPEELLAAIRKISKGGKYVCPSLVEEIISQLDTSAGRPLHTTLSNREYQVMCMFASGKNVREIAKVLALSIQTISTYRTRILDKMKLNGIGELIRYAVKHRLVE